MKNGESIFVIGYPKSGTHWLVSILSKYYSYPVSPDTPSANGGPCIVHSHAQWEEWDTQFPNSARVYYIVRDIRDCVVSWYAHYQRNISNHQMPSFGVENITQFFQKYFLDSATKQFGRWDVHIDGWTTRDTPFIKYEELILDPVKAVSLLLGQAGDPINQGRLQEAVAASSLEALKESGVEYDGALIPGDHFGSGMVGGWKRELPHHESRTILHMYENTLRAWGYLEKTPDIVPRGILAGESGAVGSLHDRFPFWKRDVEVDGATLKGSPIATQIAMDQVDMMMPAAHSMIIPSVDSALVVESGEGYYSRAISAWGFNAVIGIDENHVDIAKALSVENMRKDGIRYTHEALENIALGERTAFDFTFFLDQLQWLQDPSRTFHQLFEITGKAAFVSGHVLATDERKVEMNKARKLSSCEIPRTRFRMSKPAVVNLLRETGFRQIVSILPYARSHESLRSFNTILLIAYK